MSRGRAPTSLTRTVRTVSIGGSADWSSWSALAPIPCAAASRAEIRYVQNVRGLLSLGSSETQATP